MVNAKKIHINNRQFNAMQDSLKSQKKKDEGCDERDDLVIKPSIFVEIKISNTIDN
jgi:hypothetical protein